MRWCFFLLMVTPMIVFGQVEEHKKGLPNYVCYRVNEEMVVDGKLEEASWEQAPKSDFFKPVLASNSEAAIYETSFQLLWDDDYLYVAGRLQDETINGKLSTRDALLYQDDVFEIFIDPDGDSHNYIEVEINALNTIWDLFLKYPYRENLPNSASTIYDIPGLKTAIYVDGTLNMEKDVDRFWTVEMAIPLATFMEINNDQKIAEGSQFRFNCTRVEHISSDDVSYWSWATAPRIDFHLPDYWGYLQFTNHIVGTNDVDFKRKEDEDIKDFLRILYYRQKAYFKVHGIYCKALAELKISEANLGLLDDLEVVGSKFQYTIIVISKLTKKRWLISEDGRLRQE